MRTLAEIRSVDYGFATAGVERFRIHTPDGRYGAEETIRFQEILEERLAAVPSVEAVGMGFGVPLASGSIGTGFELLDRPALPEPDRPRFGVRPSTPGYLRASGMRLLRGRWFTSEDRRDAPAVAVISEGAARTHYGDTDPVGKQVRGSVSWGFDDDPVRTIVGVVADARVEGVTEEPEPAIYFPNAQFAANSVYVTMRLDRGARSALPEARAVLRELDRQLAITTISRIEDAVSEDQAPTRFYLALLSSFSALALVLAAVGLYGVVAYAVGQRTREIGIRIALGAASHEVTRMVLRQGMRPALAGVVLGLGVSWLGARSLATVLYRVEPYDPAAVASATGVLLAVVVLAILLPARRASRVPPASVLRNG